METILTSVVPLFAVILIGFFAGKARVIDQDGIRTLVAFVFTIAMPALLFRMMASTDIGAIDDWPVLGAYLSAQIPVFLLGVLLGGAIFRQSLAEMTIQGFGSSFSNGVVLGLPLVLSLYGERGGVTALLIIMLDILMFSTVTLLMEIATFRDLTGQRGRSLALTRDLLGSVLKNPLIVASALGIVWGGSGMALPGVVDKTLAFIGQAGPPAGLFGLGATLSLGWARGKLRPVGAMIALKLVLHPVLAWLAVSYLFRLDPVAMSVALLFAACPVGANTYVFAEHYGSAADTSATAILISTGLALFSISLLVVAMPSIMNCLTPINCLY